MPHNVELAPRPVAPAGRLKLGRTGAGGRTASSKKRAGSRKTKKRS